MTNQKHSDLTHQDLHEDILQNKTDIEIIRHDIKTIRDNHLHHIEKDMKEVKDDLKEHKKEVSTKIDKMDNRLWWILGILVVAVLVPVLKDYI